MKQFISIIILLTSMSNITFANDSKTVLEYLVRKPTILTENTPVLILLHGVGSNEQDLFSLANQIPGKYLVISARAPITLSPNSFAWYQVDFSTGKPVYNSKQEEASRIMLEKFILQIKEKYSVNKSEVYLCGFSQGAIMSYSIGLTRPDLIKGIAIMSGRLLEEIKPVIVKNEELKKLKVFISHGIDDNILQINYAKQANDYLKSININPTYKEYQAGHTISNEMLADLIQWLK